MLKLAQTFQANFPIAELQPYPGNPRRADVRAIAESIDHNGFFGAILVQKSTGYILSGNHTYLAARNAGAESIPAIVIDVNPTQAKKILLAANRIADRGSYGKNDLIALLQDLEHDLIGTGYHSNDLDLLLSDLSASNPSSAAPAGAPVVNDLEPLAAPSKVENYTSAKSENWYTPAEFIESARSVMGSIDLDPASCEFANKTVKAKTIFTKEQNGLDRDWIGSVWVNPPYGKTEDSSGSIRSSQLIWSEKLIAEYDAKNTTQAICLVAASTDTAFFHLLLERSSVCCLVSSRINFYNENGQTSGNIKGSAIFYFVDRSDPDKIAAFVNEFKKYGSIIERLT